MVGGGDCSRKVEFDDELWPTPALEKGVRENRLKLDWSLEVLWMVV